MSNNEEEDNKAQEEIYRFLQDLEFVQCLANPNYLKYLADYGYFDDENFINYLKYLLYFKKVEYMKFITYERCLIFLELLQYKEFREQLKVNNYTQIMTVNGLQTFKYSDCLNDFILHDWFIRANPKDNNTNENGKNDDKDNGKEIPNDDNKVNNDIQKMDLES